MLGFARIEGTDKVCYRPNRILTCWFPSKDKCPIPSKYVNFNQTYLGMGTRISVPSTSGFRFIPLSLIALIAAAVH